MLKYQHSVLFLLSPALFSLFASILRLVLSVWLFSVTTGLPYHPAAKNPSEKKILITDMVNQVQNWLSLAWTGSHGDPGTNHCALGEREAMVMAAPATSDSAVLPCFHGCPAFLHRHFPPQSPPSHPLDLPLHSQQQNFPWDCSTIPKLQLPAAASSRRTASLSGICMAPARTVWLSFHLGCHRSAVSLSALNVSPLTQTIAPVWGSDLCFSSSTRWGRVQSY